jgi:hypothetical protein
MLATTTYAVFLNQNRMVLINAATSHESAGRGAYLSFLSQSAFFFLKALRSQERGREIRNLRGSAVESRLTRTLLSNPGVGKAPWLAGYQAFAGLLLEIGG